MDGARDAQKQGHFQVQENFKTGVTQMRIQAKTDTRYTRFDNSKNNNNFNTHNNKNGRLFAFGEEIHKTNTDRCGLIPVFVVAPCNHTSLRFVISWHADLWDDALDYYCVTSTTQIKRFK